MQNCQEICLNLEFLISKDIIEHICPSLFGLLTEKALHPQDHKPKFEVHLNSIFQKDDEREIYIPAGMTELQKLTYKMERYKSIKKNKINRNISELSYQKVSILYDYIKTFTSLPPIINQLYMVISSFIFIF